MWYNINVNKRNEDNTMLFNKKKSNFDTDTALDKKIKALHAERLATANVIKERAKRIIICNGVIDLYPEGADKEAAKQSAERAKHLLLCSIGHYDDIRRQYLEALAENGERNTTYYLTKECKTSHEWVDMAYEEFWKKN
jgi:hypothetical protein